jgi:hypothetical protein
LGHSILYIISCHYVALNDIFEEVAVTLVIKVFVDLHSVLVNFT